MTSVASRVIRLGEELVTANLQDHLVSAPPVAAMALPLVARGAVIGAVVGLADARASAPPVFDGPARAALALLLEPAAVALDNARRIAQAEALSVTDDLTRLYNARFLNQALTREVKRVVRSGQSLSVHLPRPRRLQGRQRSARAPARAAGRWWSLPASCAAARARPTSWRATAATSSRWCCRKPARPGAMNVAERIRARVAAHVFLAGEGLDVRLTISIGIATREHGRLSAAELLQAADRAMYWVKAHGKNGIPVTVDGRLSRLGHGHWSSKEPF